MHDGSWCRRVWAAALWSALGVLALASVLGSFGRLHWLLNGLSSFRPQYVVLGALLLPAFFVLRRHRGVFLGSVLVFRALNSTYLLPYVLGGRADRPRGPASVSLLQWNTWRKNADFESVNERILRSMADVVLLQETTAQIRDHLAALESSYQVFISGDDAVLVRKPLAYPVREVRAGGLRAVHVELRLGARPIDLIGIHLRAPTSARSMRQRAEQFQALSAWVTERSSPVAVIGDLNATPWSYEIQEFRKACGLQDSFVGQGLQPTWPFHNVFTSLFRIPLDHCLHTDGLVAFDRSVGESGGSNHGPLFVRIRFAD